MFEVVDNNIFLTRGDSATIPFGITRDGSPYDFSNDFVQFTVKRNTTTETIVIQKEITGPAVVIEPEDTNELEYQTLKYDVQLITPEGEVHTVIPPHDLVLTNEVNFAIHVT